MAFTVGPIGMVDLGLKVNNRIYRVTVIDQKSAGIQDKQVVKHLKDVG